MLDKRGDTRAHQGTSIACGPLRQPSIPSSSGPSIGMPGMCTEDYTQEQNQNHGPIASRSKIHEAHRKTMIQTSHHIVLVKLMETLPLSAESYDRISSRRRTKLGKAHPFACGATSSSQEAIDHRFHTALAGPSTLLATASWLGLGLPILDAAIVGKVQQKNKSRKLLKLCFHHDVTRT